MRWHSAILERSSTRIWPPPKNSSGAKLFRENDIIFIDHVLNVVLRPSLLCLLIEVAMCFVSTRSPVSCLPRILVCVLVEFDLLFAFGVLSCWILNSASLFILYVHKHNRLGFGMLTLETAVFDCICWFSSSRDRKGQSYPVEYCLESVEEYSEGRVHKSEPEPRNGNVNTVFLNQARGNSRISRTEFVYDEREHAMANFYLCLNFLLRICW